MECDSYFVFSKQKMANNTTNPPYLHELPIEILSNIWRHLSTPCPSIAKLQDQPCYDIVSSNTKDLKSVSLVSRRLRSSVLQLLFRHACFRIDSSVDLSSRDWDASIKEFLHFAHVHGLGTEMGSFTLLVETKERQNYGSEPVPQNDFATFWTTIFSAIDPLRLTIIAPPAALAALSSMDMVTKHIADYHMPYQALSLSYPVKGTNLGQSLHGSDLIGVLHIRPWEGLLLNEGSFIRLYTQPRYHPVVVEYPPSILPALTSTSRPRHLSFAGPDQNPTVSNLPSTIRSFSYIAICPISNQLHHLSLLFSQLHTVYFQICPRSDPLPDPWQHSVADYFYLLIQRQQGYEMILNGLQKHNSTDMDHGQEWALERIECGDAILDTEWQKLVQQRNHWSDWIWKTVGENEGTLVIGSTKTFV